MNTKGMFRCIAILVGILLLAVPAVAQSKAGKAEGKAPSDERLEGLIERLEIGMSALEELERRDALEIVQRIANELREKRARSRRGLSQEENDEIKTVRRRLKVMRTAVEAFLEANQREKAELIEHAMHARELAIEGRRGEEANRVREAAPNRRQLSKTLRAAAKLYKKWDKPEQAEALAALAETYMEQWKRQQRAEREGRVTEREGRGKEREVRGTDREGEGESEEGLDSLATRVDIIRLARAAFAEAGDKKNAKVLEGVIHYGELALEGVTDDRLSKAAEAVPSRANLIEYMSRASHKYGEWGHEKRAAACRGLAEYYAGQLRAEEREGGEERAVERERAAERERAVERERAAKGNIEDLNYRIEILGFAHNAFRRSGDKEGANIMRRFLHVAELQRDGAGGEAIAKAFEGLSMGTTIELLQKASRIYAEWGREANAKACKQLAEFYAARERARTTRDR